MTRRVAFDASFLAALTDQATPIRPGDDGGESETRDRLAYLIERLDEEDADLVIPTPALAEVLSVAGRDATAVLVELDQQARFRVVPFDQRAAIECGLQIQAMLKKRRGDGDAKQALKYDAMILAITLVEQATALYTDDMKLRDRAKAAGLAAFTFADLPARPLPSQPDLPLGLAERKKSALATGSPRKQRPGRSRKG
jgi:hypothetical protein